MLTETLYALIVVSIIGYMILGAGTDDSERAMHFGLIMGGFVVVVATGWVIHKFNGKGAGGAIRGPTTVGTFETIQPGDGELGSKYVGFSTTETPIPVGYSGGEFRLDGGGSILDEVRINRGGTPLDMASTAAQGTADLAKKSWQELWK